ncbi:MAG: hypothetical protein JXP34_02180 [Planctomycetes bacterium]|nr:hypothetical protein [Planctomycetota bacterium]
MRTGLARSNRRAPGAWSPAPFLAILLASAARVGGAGAPGDAAASPPATRDTWSDTWSAVDGLGRILPMGRDVGPPRPDRQVGIFYFLWSGAHVTGGPFDVSKILAKDPEAMRKKDSPLWGPLHGTHHWGEPLFGYYNSDDPWVLRKHARMLADAGVDAVIFDVTNQVTYRKTYMALLREWAAVRSEGGRTPRVAFLCPFWSPAKVVAELYRDLYEPRIHPELWFPWEGKPLILADPDALGKIEEHRPNERADRLEAGHTLGQTFAAKQPFVAAGGCFPTWGATGSAMTLTLFRSGPGREPLATRRFEGVGDNTWLLVRGDRPFPPGTYDLEMSAPAGTIGWWSGGDTLPGGQALRDGKPADGDRSLRVAYEDERTARIRAAFTFRKPQPDYFRGPTGPDMWSWLEVYPQHVFRNARGEKEQMSVGVAQNAVGGRLGCLSEPGARGRSFHDGAEDRRPDAVLYGFNFAEQFERALREDPRFIFITGWNEWTMGRFDEFNGVRLPVMFVDQFNQECSRDIEPMRGGHGDAYYWQMAAFIRRYKGARRPPPAGPPRTIRIDGGFDQWGDVAPVYRDDIGDTFARDFPGYNDCARYVDRSGRNDIADLHVARDDRHVYFHVRTREPISPAEGPSWMWLFIDADRDPRTGWEGFDFIANRTLRDPGTAVLERNAGGWRWEAAAELPMAVAGRDLHLAVPRSILGLASGSAPLAFDFKWADGVPPSGDALEFWTKGDVAPNGRFRYRFEEEPEGAEDRKDDAGRARAGRVRAHSRGLHGYIGFRADRPPSRSAYGAGMGFYSAVWSLIDRPLAGFQIGLAGSWITPDNSDNKDTPLAPEGTLARRWKDRGPTWSSVFQTVEGGLGYWAGNHFRYGPPKFSMNATPQCYDYEIGSPGWSFFYSNEALPDDRLGIAQLSNRLLIPPDALPFAGKPEGEFLGYSWMALPFTDPTTGDPPTGDRSWTCFLSAANFKGPIAYYIPETWSKIAKLFDYPFLHGRGLDARPGEMGGGAMEINTVPCFEARDAQGVVYSKIPGLRFPVDDRGRTLLVQDVTYYSKAALYDAFKAWRDGGPACSGRFDEKGAWKATLTTRTTRYDQAGERITGVERVFDTKVYEGNVWGLEWSASDISARGSFPQYFKRVGEERVAVAAADVPEETQLLGREFRLAGRGDPYTSPAGGAWSRPGPIRGPFAVTLADGSSVTYAWYRFIDQPSFQQYAWGEEKRAKLQALVERIHANWPIDRDYMPPPGHGVLATLDPALLVTPPAGLEAGYVPIVTRQSRQ